MSENLLLGGFYGFDNVGDEAVLAAIVAAIRQEDSSIPLAALSSNPQKTAQDYGMQAVNRWHNKEVKAAMQNARLFVLGGGSLLQDVTGFKSLLFYLHWLHLAKKCNTPFFVYAQGIGPIVHGWGQKLTARMLKRAAGITLRDQTSYQMLKDWGVDPQKMQVTLDPVLAWQPTEENNIVLPSGRKCAVALRAWPGFTAQKAAQVADGIAKMGFAVVMVPFHGESDLAFAKEVAGLMQEPYFMVEELLTAPQAVALLREMDFVWGMRLHSLVMAAAAAIPFAALSYDPKVTFFAQNFTHVSCCDCTEGAETILAGIQESWQKKEQMREEFSQKKKVWQQQAQENAKLAVKLYWEAKK